MDNDFIRPLTTKLFLPAAPRRLYNHSLTILANELAKNSWIEYQFLAQLLN